MRKQHVTISLAVLAIFLTTFILAPTYAYAWPWDKKTKAEPKKEQVAEKKTEPASSNLETMTVEEFTEAGGKQINLTKEEEEAIKESAEAEARKAQTATPDLPDTAVAQVNMPEKIGVPATVASTPRIASAPRNISAGNVKIAMPPRINIPKPVKIVPVDKSEIVQEGTAESSDQKENKKD